MNIRYLVSLLLLFGFSCAHAVQLQPTAKVCNLYFKSDAVFIGKVVSTIPYNEDMNDGWTFTLKVIKSFRGVSGPTVNVFTEASSWEMILDKGPPYLLFASREYNGLLIIGPDGVSGVLDSHVLAKLKHVIAASHKKNGGEIYGRVGGDVLGKPIRGVRVRIFGADKTYQAVTDSIGWFHVRVPAGKYSAVATDPIDPKMLLVPYVLSRDNPKNFRVRNGECAELQFRK